MVHNIVLCYAAGILVYLQHLVSFNGLCNVPPPKLEPPTAPRLNFAVHIDTVAAVSAVLAIVLQERK
jgi:hypothetical protein